MSSIFLLLLLLSESPPAESFFLISPATKVIARDQHQYWMHTPGGLFFFNWLRQKLGGGWRDRYLYLQPYFTAQETYSLQVGNWASNQDPCVVLSITLALNQVYRTIRKNLYKVFHEKDDSLTLVLFLHPPFFFFSFLLKLMSTKEPLLKWICMLPWFFFSSHVTNLYARKLMSVQVQQSLSLGAGREEIHEDTFHSFFFKYFIYITNQNRSEL